VTDADVSGMFAHAHPLLLVIILRGISSLLNMATNPRRRYDGPPLRFRQKFSSLCIKETYGSVPSSRVSCIYIIIIII
jgi:hypothetical protein